MISKKRGNFFVVRVEKFPPSLKLMHPLNLVRIVLTSLAIICTGGCSLFETSVATPTEVRTYTRPGSGIEEPFGLALRNGELFISDGQRGIIWRIGSKGELSEYATGFSTPSHIDFDEVGNLYVVDSGDHSVRKIGTNGDVALVAGVAGRRGFRDGPAENALFNSPIGIAVRDDAVFIADTYNDRIRVIENGKVRSLSGGRQGFADGPHALFDTPTGLALTGTSLLVADTGNRRIRIVEEDGSASTLAGGSGPVSDGLLAGSSFSSPVDIAISDDGTVYVTDGNRLRVIGRRFIPIVETFSGGRRGFKDGKLRNSRFSRLSGLSVASNGDVYVTDSDNSLIRVLTGRSTGVAVPVKEFERSLETSSEFRKKGPARWPYKASDKTREIAGTLGEIRGEIKNSRSEAWFHNGLDVTGRYGESAHIIRDEKILRPLAVNEFGSKRENVRFPEIGYVHINLGRDSDGKTFNDRRFQFRVTSDGGPADLRIPRGTTFKRGDRIGTLNRMNHVHLIAGFTGREFNALDALNLPGVSDARKPVIEKVGLFTENWDKIETDSGEFRIEKDERYRLVVTAYDQMDGNAERRRLGVYGLRYEFLKTDGSPLTEKASSGWALFFRRTPPHEAVKLVYAPGSKSGATGTTVFNYIVSNHVDGKNYKESYLDVSGKKGSFVLRVFATDYFGNIASKDIRVTIG